MLKHPYVPTLALLAGVVMTGAVFLPTAQAHVTLASPNGGETLTGNSSYTIDWYPNPAHPMGDWDLYYSVTSNSSDWITIAENLYPGDTTPTGVHLTYSWTVPNIAASNAWVKVVQDGTTGVWFDVSDSSFEIVPEPASMLLLAVPAGVLLRKRRH